MQQTNRLTLPDLFRESVRNNPTNKSLGFVDENFETYESMDQKIQAVIAFMEKAGIKPGDKVAILSSNMPNWGIVYFAITFMGSVVVPILPDFSATEIENILNHSEAKALFVSAGLINKTEQLKSDHLELKVRLDDLSVLTSRTEVSFDALEKPEKEYDIAEDSLAAIIYTSGTTGKSKGVVLTHKNIAFTAVKTKTIQEVNATDRFLSILPLSHTYENTLGFILPMISGSSVAYLKKAPTPAVLLPALRKVKPTLMLSVPLVIEKIYRNKVLPSLTKNTLSRTLYKVPPVRKQLHRLAGKKLLKTFGGEIKFFGIGGAKLDKYVERFLREAKFPYAIGYGLTETAPLLAGANATHTKYQSTGPVMEGVTLKIHNPDPKTGEGEIWAKGDNVMQGYYKEPELTKEVITEDGWFKTGDLGVFDKNGYLYIKGRSKNMIIGDNGENIYPEEIETVINNFRHVVESIVVKQKGKLVALVHFNADEIEQKYQTLKHEITSYVETKREELRKELHEYINTHVSRFSRIQKIYIQDNPFEKTPTQKIKRFLYQKTHKNDR